MPRRDTHNISIYNCCFGIDEIVKLFLFEWRKHISDDSTGIAFLCVFIWDVGEGEGEEVSGCFVTIRIIMTGKRLLSFSVMNRHSIFLHLAA